MAVSVAALGVCLCLCLGLCGCGGGGAKPEPTINPAGAWHDRLIVALVSCFYRHNLIPGRAQGGTSPLPVRGGRLATSSAADQDHILSWFGDNGSNVMVHGNTLGNWVGNAALDTSQWPTSACGKIPPGPGPPH